MESFHLLAILGRERQVKMRGLLLGLVQAQRSLTLRTQLDAVRRRPLLDDCYAEGCECLEVERFACGIVADSEFDVVKHESLPRCAGLRGLTCCTYGRRRALTAQQLIDRE